MPIALHIDFDDNKDSISEELSVLMGAAERLSTMVRLESIHVPADFAALAASLRPQKRPFPAGGEPLILPIAGKTGWIIIVHPQLFGPDYDAHIRHALYWHELTRLVHKMQFPALRRGQVPNRETILLGEVHRAFGEYDAARKAWQWRDSLLKEHLKEPLSALARTDFIKSLDGQTSIALAAKHEGFPKSLNQTLHETGDVRGFLSNMRPFITHRTVALSLAWAAMDHDPAAGLETAGRLRALPKEARPLLGLFRNHHISGSTDLREGIPMLHALWKAWGLHMIDTDSGITIIPSLLKQQEDKA